MNYVPTTKENFFNRYKTLSDEVLMKKGYSEPVLAIIKDLKSCIDKNDVEGFWNFAHNDPRRKKLTSSEKQSLLNARITEWNISVFSILDDIDDDLSDDGTTGSIFEIFSDLDDLYLPKEPEDDKEALEGR